MTMAVAVEFSTGELWFTNSYTWHTIFEHGLPRLTDAERDVVAFSLHVGLDFGAMTDAEAIGVAAWLIATVESMPWPSAADREHLDELVGALTAERDRRRPTTGAPSARRPNPGEQMP